MTDDMEIRLKRLKFRSLHRGTKELDLILGAFAERHLDAMTPAEVNHYEAILNANEHDIYLWLTGQAPVPAEHDNAVMSQILKFDFAKTMP